MLQALSYCLYEMMDNVHIHSGRHKLIIEDGKTSVIENGFWQGTLIYMEIGTGEEIDPNQVVEYIKHTGARSRCAI